MYVASWDTLTIHSHTILYGLASFVCPHNLMYTLHLDSNMYTFVHRNNVHCVYVCTFVYLYVYVLYICRCVSSPAISVYLQEPSTCKYILTVSLM